MRLLSLLFIALISLAAKPVEPIVQRDDDGEIDWTAGELRALGVGTPKLLSPTAGVTRGDLYRAAVVDARARLGRSLDRVRFNTKRRLGTLDHPGLSARRTKALKDFEAQDARYFIDGTVHLPARLSLSWVAATLGGSPKRNTDDFAGPPLPEDLAKQWPTPTGLILRINGALSPSLRLALDFPGEQDWHAGVAGDPVAATGLRWYRAGDPALAVYVGEHPRAVDVRARGVGAVSLDAEVRAKLQGLSEVPTAVVLP